MVLEVKTVVTPGSMDCGNDKEPLEGQFLRCWLVMLHVFIWVSLMRMRAGPKRRQKTKELVPSNCGARGRLLKVPWTVKRLNQSILSEINPEYSLEGLILKLKLQYFGHIMRIVTHWKSP